MLFQSSSFRGAGPLPMNSDCGSSERKVTAAFQRAISFLMASSL